MFKRSPNPRRQILNLFSDPSAPPGELNAPPRKSPLRFAVVLVPLVLLTAAGAEGPKEDKQPLSRPANLPLSESLALVLPQLYAPATSQEAGTAILSLSTSTLQGPQAAANAASLIDPLYQVTQV